MSSEASRALLVAAGWSSSRRVDAWVDEMVTRFYTPEGYLLFAKATEALRVYGGIEVIPGVRRLSGERFGFDPLWAVGEKDDIDELAKALGVPLVPIGYSHQGVGILAMDESGFVYVLIHASVFLAGQTIQEAVLSLCVARELLLVADAPLDATHLDVPVYPYADDVTWYAFDVDEAIGAFTSNGYGPIPLPWLMLSEPQKDTVHQYVTSLPARFREDELVIPSAQNSGRDWEAFAKQGVFALDWTLVNSGTVRPMELYELAASPPVWATLEAPVELLRWRALLTLNGVRFSAEGRHVDVRAAVDCLLPGHGRPSPT
ncbi:MAG: SUKH-3 domain-containing protein [Polyangiaceae bacterium]